MFRKKIHPIAFILIGLGIIGLLAKGVNDPIGSLEILALIAAIVMAGFLLYQFFTKKNRVGRNRSGYERAVKQSIKKYKKKKINHPSYLKVVNTQHQKPRKLQRAPLQKRKEDHHLKVIDGKKRKKKKRALF